MKFEVALLFSLIIGPLNVLARDVCLLPENANMPPTKAIEVPQTDYTVSFCYLQEVKNAGVFQDHKDLIVLKKKKLGIAKQSTKMSITSGRISDLKLEKFTDRFVAVSYTAGEYCNGVVIFDVKKKRSVANKHCVTETDRCRVTELTDGSCKAKIVCEDMGSAGEPPMRKEPSIFNVDLCGTSKEYI